MTLLHLNSCSIAPEYEYSIEHTSYVVQSSTFSRTGASAIRCNAGYDFRYHTTASEGVCGFAMYLANMLTTENTLCGLYSYLGALHLRVTFMPDGTLAFERSTTVLQRSTQSLRLARWNYIEIKWSISNSIAADSCIVLVNGVEWLNLPATTDTQNATAVEMGYLLLNGIVTYTYFADIYVCDLNGSINNDFLGPLAVEQILPNGNGSTSDFVGSDSDSIDNYLHVDDVSTDDDATYVESATVGDIDLYAYTSLSGIPTSIVGLVARPIAKKQLGGSRLGKIITRVNITNYDGDTMYVGVDFKVEPSVWELNPDDSAAWEAADVNGAEFGVEVQA